MFPELLKRLKFTVSDVLFPVFSEINAIALLYALVIAAIEYRGVIASTAGSLLIDNLFSSAVIFLGGLGLASFAAFQIVQTARRRRSVKKSTRYDVAALFYVGIAMLTVSSVMATPEWISTYASNWRANIIVFVQVFSLLRSVIALAVMRSLEHTWFLATRFQNYQTSPRDLVIILAAVPLFYWLNYGYDPASLVLVSYFYTVVLVSLTHELLDSWK